MIGEEIFSSSNIFVTKHYIQRQNKLVTNNFNFKKIIDPHMYQFQTTKFMTYYRMRIVAIYNGFSIMITFSRDSIIIDLKPKPILTQNY